MGILRKGIALWDGVWYNVDATQTNKFQISAGKYLGNKCFLSLLIPADKDKSLCRNNEGLHFLQVRFLHWGALFCCVPINIFLYEV